MRSAVRRRTSEERERTGPELVRAAACSRALPWLGHLPRVLAKPCLIPSQVIAPERIATVRPSRPVMMNWSCGK